MSHESWTTCIFGTPCSSLRFYWYIVVALIVSGFIGLIVVYIVPPPFEDDKSYITPSAALEPYGPTQSPYAKGRILIDKLLKKS